MHAIRPGWNSGRCPDFTILSRVADDVVNPKVFFFIVGQPLRTFENHFLLIFLLLQVSVALQFGQSDHSLLIYKIGNLPLPLLLIPVRIVDDQVELVLAHQDV